MNTISIAVIGGDLRYVRLCQILCQKGFAPLVYGITHPDIPAGATICHDLEDISKCQFIIGPIPFSKDGKSLFTPLSNMHISIERFMEVASNSHVLIGALKPQLRALFEKHNLSYTDMMDLDEVAILNAIPTQMRIGPQYILLEYDNTLYDHNPKSIGYKLYMRRKELKLCKKDVCDDIGISKNTLWRYEKGISVPNKKKLELLISYLGIHSGV